MNFKLTDGVDAIDNYTSYSSLNVAVAGIAVCLGIVCLSSCKYFAYLLTGA